MHPSPQLPPVHDAERTVADSEVSEDVDNNMPVVYERLQDPLDESTMAA